MKHSLWQDGDFLKNGGEGISDKGSRFVLKGLLVLFLLRLKKKPDQCLLEPSGKLEDLTLTPKPSNNGHSCDGC